MKPLKRAYGVLECVNKIFELEEQMRISSLEDIFDEDLIAEAERRGFKMI